jgi:16S rRNA (uracil1498-N3)-methyltransferase
MSRIFIPNASTQEGKISVTGEKARYIASVLRCKTTDELIVFDGKGNCLRTNILKADRREVVVKVLETFPCDTESPVNIVLIQGLLKGQKMDLVIQKTTELGVKEIIPVITDRSQPRETRKVSRWQKIAEEASRQSGRSVVPVVHEPMNFIDWLSLLSDDEIKGLIFYEEGGIKISEAVLSLVTHHLLLPIVIGPEGGFIKGEVEVAEKKGFIITSLGKRILRSETAAISAMTLVQFLLGDLN